MNATISSRVPMLWVPSRDVPFFGVTAHLFSPPFVAGASALLASYDPGEAGFAVRGGSSGIATGISPDSENPPSSPSSSPLQKLPGS